MTIFNDDDERTITFPSQYLDNLYLTMINILSLQHYSLFSTLATTMETTITTTMTMMTTQPLLYITH
jgi:hypothetical protein